MLFVQAKIRRPIRGLPATASHLVGRFTMAWSVKIFMGLRLGLVLLMTLLTCVAAVLCGGPKNGAILWRDSMMGTRAAVAGVRVTLVGLLCVVAAGCGGGGSAGATSSAPPGGIEIPGVLQVTFRYPAALPVFVPTTQQPTTSGFGGHQPRCTVTQGPLPPGITMDSACVLRGMATRAGTYPIQVQVGADGVSNTVSFNLELAVSGPTVYYGWRDNSSSPPMSMGSPVDDVPYTDPTFTWAGLNPQWTYTVTAGALPPGLNLDPRTGAVTGASLATGSYSATISAHVQTSAGTYDTPSSEPNYFANVTNAALAIYDAGGTGRSQNGSSFEIRAFVAVPFNVQVQAPFQNATHSNFQLTGTLPAGLNFDPVTGTVSGTPLPSNSSGGIQPGGYEVSVNVQTVTISTTVTMNGTTFQATATYGIAVLSPVTFYFPPGQATAKTGVPATIAPVVYAGGAVSLISPSYSYRINSSQSFPGLPPGMSVDPVTGVISGTPTQAGTYEVALIATIASNGMTWDQWFLTPVSIVVN